MKVTIFDGNQQPISHLECNSTLKLESTQLSTGTRNLQDENRDEEYATKDDKSAATDCERDVVTQTTQEEHTKQAGTDVLDKEGETDEAVKARIESLAKFERDMEAFLNKEDATSQQGDAKGVSVPAARKAKQAYSSLKKYAKAKVAARKEEENRRLLRELARAKMAARKADDDDDDASSDNTNYSARAKMAARKADDDDDDDASSDNTNYSAIEFLYSVVDTLQDAVEELEERYDADHDPVTDCLNDLVDWYDTFDLMDALKDINGNVCKAIFPNDTDGANPEAQAKAGDQDNARSLKEALTDTESVQEDLQDDVDIDEWLMEKKRETKEKFKNADAARKMAAKKQAKKKAEILVSKPAGLMRRGNLGKTKLSIKKP